MKDLDNVLKNVLKKIKPKEKEEKELESLVERTLEITNQEAKRFGAEAILAGSLGRGTWLTDKNEFDLFIMFPKTLLVEKLEEYGLKIGKKVIKKLKGKWRLEYAQHPYVRGFVGKIQIDIVPCYKIEHGEKTISAVDRTPFHVEYLEKRLTVELSDEVRLLKQFLKGNCIYGADAKTEGFSGYICELLIINYGSFVKSLKAASAWRPGQIIDVENQWDEKDYRKLKKMFKNEVLVIIDPVDKNRNAAAAVSATSFFRFKKNAIEFLKNPSESFFFKKESKPLNIKQLERYMKIRGTELLAVKFKPPDVVSDILWPQLRKTTKRLEGILKEYEFVVNRSDFWTDGKKLAVVILEMEVSRLPFIDKRIGPLVFDLDDSDNFINKYKKQCITEPFIEENRWCVEIKRDWVSAKEKLIDSLNDKESILKAKGIPNYIARSISERFDVLGIEGVKKLMKNKEFAIFMRKYFEKEVLV